MRSARRSMSSRPIPRPSSVRISASTLGVRPWRPPSTTVQPLFLHHPYDESYDPKAGLSSALFDPFRTGGKKYKSKPETADEIAECRATLTPEELGLVTGGPKTIEFGTVSVFTQVTRCSP